MKRSLVVMLTLAGCQNFGEAYDRCVDAGACTDAPGGGTSGAAGGTSGSSGGAAGGGFVASGGQGGGNAGGAVGGGQAGGAVAGGSGGGVVVGGGVAGGSVDAGSVDAGPGFTIEPPDFPFGRVLLFDNTVTARQLQVTNTSSGSVLVNVMLLGADAMEFPLTQNNCSGMVGSNAVCTALLTFAPVNLTLGPKSASLRVQVGSSVLMLPVSGESAAPVTFSPALLDFRDVNTGGAVSLPLTITNHTPGLVPLVLALMPPFSADTACATLTPGDCISQVTFMPTDAGVFAANLTTQVTVNSRTFNPPAVALRGNGVALGSLSFGPDPFAGGVVDAGTALDRPFTLSNNGPTMVGPIGLALTGPGAAAFSIVDAGCATIAAGGSCGGVLRFVPTQNATYTASLLADGGLAGLAFLNLFGRGYEAARLQWVGDAGVWATNADVMQTFTLQNVSSGGSARLNVSLTDAGMFGWRLEPDSGVGGCVSGVTTLDAGASCNVNVTFLAGQGNTPNGLSTAVLRATAPDAGGAVRVLQGTADYHFIAGPTYGFPAASPLINMVPARPCLFRNDGENQLLANAPNGTQLEFVHEPSMDASRCPGQWYFEVPTKNSMSYPGGIRECGTTATFPSGDEAGTAIGSGAGVCLPVGTANVWGANGDAGTCRTTYTRIGKVWNCQ